MKTNYKNETQRNKHSFDEECTGGKKPTPTRSEWRNE